MLSCRQTNRRSKSRKLVGRYQGNLVPRTELDLEDLETRCSWTRWISTRRSYMPAGTRGRAQLRCAFHYAYFSTVERGSRLLLQITCSCIVPRNDDAFYIILWRTANIPLASNSLLHSSRLTHLPRRRTLPRLQWTVGLLKDFAARVHHFHCQSSTI